LCGKFDQYDVALALAKSQKLGPSIIAGIHRNKGDTNYDKRRYPEAIQEYVQTIGSLEPSYVIQRFLDPQHAPLLVTYLEKLLQREQSASPSAKKLQTKLLFNCYTKLKQTTAIRTAIEETLSAVVLGAQPLFDIPTAVDVLNRGDYPEAARELAAAFQQHELYLQLLRDADDYETMADYILKLPSSVSASSIVTHGQTLLDNLNEPSQREFATHVVALITTDSIDPNQFRTVFSLHHDVYFFLLSQLAAADAAKLSQFLWDDYVLTAVSVSPEALPDILRHPAAKYSSEQALTVLRECWARMVREDPEYECIRFALRCLYERRGMFYDILEIANPEEYLEICETYADRCPVIWREAIKKALPMKNSDVTKRIVHRALEGRVMSYNTEVGLLSKNTESVFECIRGFAIDGLEKLADEIQEREDQLSRLDTELTKNERLIDQMTNDYFAMKPGLCHLCGLKLDAPCRYFRCGHSYHIRCLGDEVHACKECRNSLLKQAEAKRDAIAAAQEEGDLQPKLTEAEDPLAMFMKLMCGAYFSASGEGGDDDVLSMIARLSESGSDMA
jgi:hypothetical protein